MFKGFTQIDLFGKAVLFTYKGNSTSKSKVGAICTILLFGFIIWLMVYFGQALFDKSNPQATTFESYNENPSATTLTTDSFVFAIGLADPVSYVNFINESIFTVYASTYKAVRTPQANGSVTITYEQIPLEIVSCESEYFGDLADQFTYLSLDQLYCIKPNQTALTYGFPVLEGSFESPTYQSVYIEFTQCDNTTSSCGTPAEIDKALRGAYMSLVYSNIAVDLTNSKAPLKQFRDSYYTTVDNYYYKEITMYIQQLEINTDDGFLTTSYETEDYISFGEIREFLSLTPKSSFAYFSMRLSNVETHYNRSYTKLQTIIAQVNGIITVVFTALFFILAPYVRLKFYEALINEIFDIKRLKETVNKVLKRNSTQQSVKKPDSKSNNSKKRKSKSKSPASKKPSSQEDLEQQIPSPKPRDESATNNISDLMDKKDREFEISVKRRPSLEDSVQENHSPTLSPVARDARQSSTFKDAEPQDKKDKAHYSRFRGLPPPLTISRSESDNKPLNLELSSPLETPNSSKVGILLSSRKPTFKQPDCKTLDYEDQGRDQYEDMLQNIDHDHMKYKVPVEEYATSGIRSERGTEGLNSKENKKTTYRDVWPPETVVSGGEEEKPREENEIKQEAIKGVSLQRLDEVLFKASEKVNLSFGEYLRSWFSKSETIKEKMYILNEGIARINERLDIFNLFKKLREFDKLKVLLMESEQLVLFDSLPKPELALKVSDVASTSNLPSRHTIKDAQFIQEKKKKDLILEYYSRLKHKEAQSAIDKKLVHIYEDIFNVGSRDL